MADASIVRNMLIGGIGVSVLLAVFQWLFFGGTATPLATELWHRDLGTAIDAGEQHRRPLLVLFVDDSASSVALEAQVLASPWARMATDRFIPVRLDARQKSGLAAELGARATPWMVGPPAGFW